MRIIFDINAEQNDEILSLVKEFLEHIPTLEQKNDTGLTIFQDGKSQAYYTKCNIPAYIVGSHCDTNAKLDVENEEAFRSNRELLLENKTFKKMENDAKNGREFNDIIVEYTKVYQPNKPLKVWGGQHRIHAIMSSVDSEVHTNRYHGFKIYFRLSKDQRTEVALISNTNISVSNDTFDRMVEETLFGDALRRWCNLVGLLPNAEDFPDVGSKSEYITVKLARTFIVNFYRGKETGRDLKDEDLDSTIYEPYEASSGASTADPEYEQIVKSNNILSDNALIEAGKNFSQLHEIQRKVVQDSKSSTPNRKQFRNKALSVSILCGWSFVAGLLQSHPNRLNNHYQIPQVSKKNPDPLNAVEMSNYRHNKDAPTYRGLGTRTNLEDKQRVVQVFLAKSKSENVSIDKQLINKAVSQLVGLKALREGY